jgi:pimeloyl-ACP methyl ester carboxylesterase
MQAARVLRSVLSALVSILKWIAITLLVTLVAVLVVVSLFWGPTHWAPALLLAAAWVALLAALVLAAVRFRSGRGVLGAVLGFFTLGLITVVASQLSAYTPPILDSQGKPIPGSIASLETVDINGSVQWISVRAADTEKPVLMWLAGGPGGSQLATARYHLAGLEEHFVVVNWEQPGSGKSYDAVRHSTLTVDRYVTDAYALVQYLKQRFDEEKVYIVGESWGSALGVWLVQRYPDEFHAFVGTGQMVDFLETELYDYNFALNLAKERGNTKKVQELERQGPPPYEGGGVLMRQSAYLLDGFAYMNENPAISNEDGFDTFKDLLSPEYGLYDKVSWARGVFDAGDVMFPQLWKADVDFRRDAPSLNVPSYFLIGRHDVNALPALAEEYYSMLDVPSKAFIWFERSGHNPWVTEPDRFVDVVVNKVLAETQPAR